MLVGLNVFHNQLVGPAIAERVDVEPVYSERLETMPVERCRTYRNAERIERDPYLRRQYEDDDYPREGSPWRGHAST